MSDDEEQQRLAEEMVEETISQMPGNLPESAKNALRTLLLSELLTDPEYKARLREVAGKQGDNSGTVDRTSASTAERSRKDGTG